LQTFLPYSDFNESAKCLDNKRLGKQRVEAYQIMNALSQERLSTNPNAIISWSNHPATRMWSTYEAHLALYGLAICEEWKHRGFSDSLQDKFNLYLIAYRFHVYNIPPWLGNETLHASHRSNLLRKDPVYYSQFNWTEPNNLEYYWPSNEKH